MNRGTKDSYSQISGNEDIIEYDINLYNPDNNIIIEIPLVKSLYGNIDLSIIYDHQAKNQTNIIGKGFQGTLNLYGKAFKEGMKSAYKKEISTGQKSIIKDSLKGKSIIMVYNMCKKAFV